MPELPEVEVVRTGMAPAVTGAVVAAVHVLEDRSVRRHDRSTGDFAELLTGQRVLAAVRRGKFLWLPLESGLALVLHLGMSGQVLLRAPGAGDERQLRIRLHLEHLEHPEHLKHPEHRRVSLHFVDQRMFGGMAVDRLLPTRDGRPGGFSGAATGGWAGLIPGQVAHIARDPLDPDFSARDFLAALARRRTGVKRALLDQTLVSGIGNIYADEALYAARLHYALPAGSLTRPEALRLLAAVRVILRRALAEGGTSFDAQYVNVNGESGSFSHRLAVYGKQGTPCPRCGGVLVRERFMNRSSHFCPRCQRLPAAARTLSRPRSVTAPTGLGGGHPVP